MAETLCDAISLCGAQPRSLKWLKNLWFRTDPLPKNECSSSLLVQSAGQRLCAPPLGYDGGMKWPLYSSRRLLVAVMLIAISAGTLALAFQLNRLRYPSALCSMLWFSCPPIFGAGIGTLFRHPFWGAGIATILFIAYFCYAASHVHI